MKISRLTNSKCSHFIKIFSRTRKGDDYPVGTVGQSQVDKRSQWKNRSIALPTLQNAVLLNLWEDKRMYVNDCARKTYGYIDFRNSKEIIETDPKKIAAEEDVCKQVLHPFTHISKDCVRRKET